MTKKYFPILIILFFLNQNVFSQNRIRGFNVQAENDVFSGLLGLKNEDKDYTGGFKFEIYTDYLKKGIFPFFKNRGYYRKDSLFIEKDSTNYNVNSIYIHGFGFTPNRDSFAVSNVVKSQRPYSSILAMGFRRIAVFSPERLPIFSGGFSIVSDLFVGQVGTKIPGDFQNFLHHYITNSKTVMGWQNQIGNGAKWAFNYLLNGNFGYDLKFIHKKNPTFFYVSPHVSLGNIFINTGGKLSISNLNPSLMGIINPMRSFAISDIQNNNKNFNNFFSHFKYEFYYRMVYVNYNTLLMGMPMYDNSVYTVDKKDIISVINDFGGKLIFQYYPEKKANQAKTRINSVYFEVISRSKEFSYGQTHVYGNIGVTVFNL